LASDVRVGNVVQEVVYPRHVCVLSVVTLARPSPRALSTWSPFPDIACEPRSAIASGKISALASVQAGRRRGSSRGNAADPARFSVCSAPPPCCLRVRFLLACRRPSGSGRPAWPAPVAGRPHRPTAGQDAPSAFVCVHLRFISLLRSGRWPGAGSPAAGAGVAAVAD
jgi:hypothetical protein